MKISSLSKDSGISIDTLRYYDKIGLLVPKRKNNIRNYNEKDLNKLNQIKLMKNLMFTLEEIKNIFDLDEKIDNDLLKNKLDTELVITLLKQIQIKQKDILILEENLKEIKSQLEHIINKINSFLKEDNNE